MVLKDQDNFLRRVPTHRPNYIKPDGTITRFSFMTRKGEDGLSGDIESMSSFESATLNDSRYRLLKINIGIIRNKINDGLDVIYNPLPDNLAHALITGNITNGKAGQLLSNSEEIFQTITILEKPKKKTFWECFISFFKKS